MSFLCRLAPRRCGCVSELFLKLVIRFYSFIFPLKLSPMQCQSNIKWNWMAFQFARAFHTKNVKFVLQHTHTHIHDDSPAQPVKAIHSYRSQENFANFVAALLASSQFRSFVSILFLRFSSGWTHCVDWIHTYMFDYLFNLHAHSHTHSHQISIVFASFLRVKFKVELYYFHMTMKMIDYFAKCTHLSNLHSGRKRKLGPVCTSATQIWL